MTKSENLETVQYCLVEELLTQIVGTMTPHGEGVVPGAFVYLSNPRHIALYDLIIEISLSIFALTKPESSREDECT